MKYLLAVLAVTLPLAALAAVAPPTPNVVLRENVQIQRFYGYAYDLDSGKYRYTEVHVRQMQGDRPLDESITFFSPDGTLIAKKIIDFSANPYLPLFRIDVLNVHHSEGISKVTPDEIYAFRQNAHDGAPQQKAVTNAPNTVTASGLDNFIRAKFPELLNHQAVTVPFFVASALKSREFTISRLKDGTFENHPTVRFKIAQTSMLRLLVGRPIILSYDPQTRRLLEYRGVSELYDPRTDNPYMVRVDYFSQPPVNAPEKLPPLDPDASSK